MASEAAFVGTVQGVQPPTTPQSQPASASNVQVGVPSNLIKVTVPTAAAAGQQIQFTTPEGVRVMTTLQEPASAGTVLTIATPNAPSQLSQPLIQTNPTVAPVQMMGLPTNSVTPEQVDRQNANYSWIAYLASVAICLCGGLPVSMLVCGAVGLQYFCKSREERLQRPRQYVPACVALSTLGVLCACTCLAVVAMVGVGVACGQDLEQCPGLRHDLKHWHPHHHHHHHWDQHHPPHGDDEDEDEDEEDEDGDDENEHDGPGDGDGENEHDGDGDDDDDEKEDDDDDDDDDDDGDDSGDNSAEQHDDTDALTTTPTPHVVESENVNQAETPKLSGDSGDAQLQLQEKLDELVGEKPQKMVPGFVEMGNSEAEAPAEAPSDGHKFTKFLDRLKGHFENFKKEHQYEAHAIFT